jgi:beta-glucanase (GH16 family)
MYIKKLFTGLVFLFSIHALCGQDSNGGEIATKESYLYGRFEVVMQSAPGDGIVSSFFLYNIEAGKTCTWPQENNEIDVEMTGNNERIYFTTHHPDPVQPWHYGENFILNFSPHDALHKYVMEWEPGIVRWLVDDQLIYAQNDDATENLKHPMAIIMNLWASDAKDWVGVWNPSVLPRQSIYDYVRYYRYTPEQGNAGTNNNFTLEWEDQFNSIDTSRWSISEFVSISELTTFRKSNVLTENNYLILTLDEPQPSNEVIPVTFSVDLKEKDLLPSDVIYVNGSFNNWCGGCNPMTESNNVWSTTLDLPPGKYEYLFTKNIWEETGGTPPGSECDYNPCDEFFNYGIVISPGSSAMAMDTICWGQCAGCEKTTGLDETKIEPVYVYPNPATSYIHVERNSAEAAPYYLVNIAGKQVMNDIVVTGRLELDLTRLPAGIYFLKIDNQAIKIIKQ